ncbi:MAG: hypothetical protein HFI45_17625 [Lachnospiraceae bacterium]|nr:hypothetical protein [Lachnospiraceae bacterium]
MGKNSDMGKSLREDKLIGMMLQEYEEVKRKKSYPRKLWMEIKEEKNRPEHFVIWNKQDGVCIQGSELLVKWVLPKTSGRKAGVQVVLIK